MTRLGEGRSFFFTVIIFALCTLICSLQSNPQSKEISSQSTSDEYKLSPGDVLTIIVFDEPELSGEFTIGPDGYLRYPFIGRIKAGGITIEELTEKIKGELAKHIKYPYVSISVKQYAQPPAIKFFVFGAVKQPGVHKAEGGVNLMEAIAHAGGFIEGADEKQVKIIRAGGVTIIVDMERMIREGTVSEVQLQNGDVVYVPLLTGSKPIQVTILGSISKPGTYKFSHGVKVTELLAEAGPPAQSAADEALIISSKDSIPKRINLKKLLQDGDISLNISLNDGDIVFIPAREVREVIILGGVQKPGSYPIDGPQKLLSILAMAGGIVEGKNVSTATIFRSGQKPEVINLAKLIQEGEVSLNKLIQPGDVILVSAPKTIRVTLWGESKTQGTFEVQEGTLLVDLLTKAGGINDKADISNITLVRGDQRHRIDLLQFINGTDLSANVELLDGDVIIVPALERILVVGDVKNPGSFHARLGMTIVDALSAAGGVNEGADLGRVRVLRNGQVEIINAESFLKGGDLRIDQYRLLPGDTLVVPRKGSVYILGAVNKAGMHPLKEGDTVLELLTYAGGLAQNADLKNTTIIRLLQGKPTVLSVDVGKLLKGDFSHNPMLQPGDIVIIPFKAEKRRIGLFEYLGAVSSLAWTIRLLWEARVIR